MEANSQLLNSFIYLVAIVLAVPGARRLGLGPVLGYLVAGVLIGPWGLAVIREAPDISQLAALASSALLFLLGFELRLRALRLLGRNTLIKGLLFWFSCFGFFSLIGITLELAWHEAMAVAIALAFSSHTLVNHFLQGRNLSNTPRGDSVQSILQIQALLILPLLVLLPLFGFGNTSQENLGWVGTARVILVVSLVIVAGRFALHHAFRYISATGLADIFAAFVLMLVIGLVLLMENVGASFYTGAFLAGCLVGNSESRCELEHLIEPIKGLLLGLFFVSMGLMIDFGLLVKYPHIVLAVLLVMMFVKVSMVVIIGYFETATFSREHLLPAVLVAPAGELSCVLLLVAMANQAIDAELGAGMIVVVALSLLITPLLQILYNRRVARELTTLSKVVDSQNADPVLLVGFGRVGQVVGRLLKSASIDATVVDYDPLRLDRIRQFGFNSFCGDALRPELLELAGVAQAQVLVVAIDDRNRALELVGMVQSNWPGIQVVARSHDRLHLLALNVSGVKASHRDTFEAAVLIGEDVLNCLGTDIDETERISEAFRDHDERLLNEDLEALGDSSQSPGETSSVESASSTISQQALRESIDGKRHAREELVRLLARDQLAYEKEQALKLAGD